MNFTAHTIRRAMLAAAAATVATFAVGAAPATAAPGNDSGTATSLSAPANVQHGAVGTYILFQNSSQQLVWVQQDGKQAEPVHPGDSCILKGASWSTSADDVKRDLRFSDGSTMPLYGNNPLTAEAYVQVAGFKWLGDGTDTINGQTFAVDNRGHIEHPEGTDKYWVMQYLGSR